MATRRSSPGTEAIELFDLDGVGRGASRMDYAKLTHLNGVWLRQADDARLTRRCRAQAAGPARFDARMPAPQRASRADARPEGACEDPGGTG